MFTRPEASARIDMAIEHIGRLETTGGWPSLAQLARFLRDRFDDVQVVDVLMDATEPGALYLMHRRDDAQVLTLAVASEGAQFSGAHLHPDGTVSRFNGTLYAPL